jgi:hypothetical protein
MICGAFFFAITDNFIRHLMQFVCTYLGGDKPLELSPTASQINLSLQVFGHAILSHESFGGRIYDPLTVVHPMLFLSTFVPHVLNGQNESFSNAPHQDALNAPLLQQCLLQLQCCCCDAKIPPTILGRLKWQDQLGPGGFVYSQANLLELSKFCSIILFSNVGGLLLGTQRPKEMDQPTLGALISIPCLNQKWASQGKL